MNSDRLSDNDSHFWSLLLFIILPEELQLSLLASGLLTKCVTDYLVLTFDFLAILSLTVEEQTRLLNIGFLSLMTETVFSSPFQNTFLIISFSRSLL